MSTQYAGMQLSTVRVPGGAEPKAVVVDSNRGFVEVSELVGGSYPDAGSVIRAGVTGRQLLEALSAAASHAFGDPTEVTFLAPIQHPGMIWGIGLNYREHAADLSEQSPAREPASFVKGPRTVIGPGDPIAIPWQSQRTTAEAELGIVFGAHARNVARSDALDVIWGVVPILDQTAEDILKRNPRNLTLSKNFPGFFSFGPGIVPLCELERQFDDIDDVVVQTVINGRVHRENQVRNMMFPPRDLVSFHTHVFPFEPADVISTGTPGAVVVAPGDSVECRIERVGTLQNPVVAGEKEPASR